MELLNNLREKVSVAAIEAVKKSGEVMETVKINFAIADKEAEISKEMREIGKLVYEGYKSAGQTIDGDIAAKCAVIDASFEEIALLKARLTDLRQLKTCASCGFETRENSNFCPRCGATLDGEQAAEPPKAETAETAEPAE